MKQQESKKNLCVIEQANSHLFCHHCNLHRIVKNKFYLNNFVLALRASLGIFMTRFSYFINPPPPSHFVWFAHFACYVNDHLLSRVNTWLLYILLDVEKSY